MEDRVWALEGVRNFRDFGGYATADGRTVKRGRLFRAAHFADATAADIARLEALGAVLVMDLRGTPERQASPSLWPASGGAPILVREGHATPPADAPPPPPGALFAAGARNLMIHTYRRIALDPGFQAAFGRFLKTLADTGGPVIVHCTAGKDRTGVASAIILAALGVDEATIHADYRLSGMTLSEDERRRLVRMTVRAETDQPLSDEDIAPLIGVEPDYIAAALEAVQSLGGVEAYARGALGLTDADLAQLRSRLLD